MPATPKEAPDPLPPRGVPRWLWPPPGARVERVVILERVDAEGSACYGIQEGTAPEALHVRALEWLLDEHGFGSLPPQGSAFEGLVLLEIARTDLPAGRVGHAYALNGGPLGAPAGDAARGILRRYLSERLGRALTSSYGEEDPEFLDGEAL
jgi:hypothetical protein